MKDKGATEMEQIKKIQERAKAMNLGHTLNYLINISKNCLEDERLEEEKNEDKNR